MGEKRKICSRDVLRCPSQTYTDILHAIQSNLKIRSIYTNKKNGIAHFMCAFALPIYECLRSLEPIVNNWSFLEKKTNILLKICETWLKFEF